jgi:dihydrofolate reductase
MISIIVATDANNGIGINNQLPWHLPEDLAHFKKTTQGHSIIMGRKTFDSIGRALPNRRNIVITRNPVWTHANVETANSLEDAINLVGTMDAFIIGGAQIYQQSLPLANQLIITRIENSYLCDAFFPEISKEDWREVSKESHISEKSDLAYSFIVYQRK